MADLILILRFQHSSLGINKIHALTTNARSKEVIARGWSWSMNILKSGRRCNTFKAEAEARKSHSAIGLPLHLAISAGIFMTCCMRGKGKVRWSIILTPDLHVNFHLYWEFETICTKQDDRSCLRLKALIVGRNMYTSKYIKVDDHQGFWVDRHFT